MKKLIRKLALVLVLALLSAGVLGCGSTDTGSAASAGSAATITSETAASEAEDAASEASENTDTEIADSEIADSEITDSGSTDSGSVEAADANASDSLEMLDEDDSYDSKEDVALYLYEYGKLPSNYITKKEAQNLGWSGGSVEQYAEGKCIGGSYFGNNEGILPDGNYHECDIDTLGAKSRGAKRIVYSDDGNIYYTEDHYETFTLLYTADGPSDGNTVYGN